MGIAAGAWLAGRATMAETDLPYALVLRKGGIAEASLDEVPPAPRSVGQHRDPSAGAARPTRIAALRRVLDLVSDEAALCDRLQVWARAVHPRRPTPRPVGQDRDLSEGGARPTRTAALRRVLDLVPAEAALIATTGKCGRELFTLADRPQHLYQVGSMGCAGAMGLGVALNPRRPVVVLDGDGAALPRVPGRGANFGPVGAEKLSHCAALCPVRYFRSDSVASSARCP